MKIVHTTLGTPQVETFGSLVIFGEVFEAHHPMDNGKPAKGFRVSHVGTGFGVPDTYGETAEESLELAKAILERNGEEKVKAGIEKAGRIK